MIANGRYLIVQKYSAELGLHEKNIFRMKQIISCFLQIIIHFIYFYSRIKTEHD